MPDQRPCVLVVEDAQDIRMLLEEFLAEHGCLVLSSTGSDAVQIATAEQPSLVLLDLHLEHLRGEDIFTALRAQAETAAIPIIIFSAVSRAVHIAEELGADGVIQKPFALSTLLDYMQKLLAAHHQPPLKEFTDGAGG